MSHRYTLSRTITINGEEKEITVEIEKTEKIENMIVTKRTLTDDEGTIWNVTGEREVESHRDQFG